MSQPPRHGGNVQRRLFSRHLEMIAIGGTIGTGLFVGSGATIAVSGPLGALVGYAIVGILVFFITTALGELAAHMPVAGSFVSFAGRFIDPALAFTLGWNYWFQWAISLPSELSAAGIIISFWSQEIRPWIWSASILFILVCIHLLGVQSFGETEYWLSVIKVVTIVVFIITGIIVDAGSFGAHEPIGFKNWIIPDAPFKGTIKDLVRVFIIAFFGFGGTELIGLTAAEAVDPHKTVPRAVKRTFWRILLFYFISVFIIGLVIPHTDPRLLNADKNQDVTISPFTLVFELINFPAASHTMNAVILIAVLSAASSAMYAASRTLMSMGREGTAPAIFGHVNSRGVPIYSIAITTLFGCLALLGFIWGQDKVFEWLLSVAGVSGILTWLSIAVVHLRFRAAMRAQKIPISTLPYTAPFFPYGDYIAIVLGLAIIAAQGYVCVTDQDFRFQNLIGVYGGIPLFVGVYFVYRWVKKTKFVSLEECDVSSYGSSLPQHQDDSTDDTRSATRVAPTPPEQDANPASARSSVSDLDPAKKQVAPETESEQQLPSSNTTQTTIVLLGKNGSAQGSSDVPPPY